MALDADIVALFRCPKCHGSLTPIGRAHETSGFGCAACKLLYPVEDDLPTFLVEEAKPWDGRERETAR